MSGGNEDDDDAKQHQLIDKGQVSLGLSSM